MSEEDREEWYLGAVGQLRSLPADLFERGIEVAGRYCDHPAKIVPTIMREIERPWAERQRQRDDIAARLRAPSRNPWDPTPFDPADRCSGEEARTIMEECGISTRTAKRDIPRGQPTLPTVEFYMEVGGLTRERAEAAVSALRGLPLPRQRDAAVPVGRATSVPLPRQRPV
ncbi:MAG TPA: hypothetical protein VF503_09095 [Sphingobium sp.]|uniref:hypothetical protein n=1 Tax=Sphingobium sp. TaxID=1912891 RepID=UPI002ED32D6B